MSVAQIPASKHTPDWFTNIFPTWYWLIKPKKGGGETEQQKWTLRVLARKANQSWHGGGIMMTKAHRGKSGSTVATKLPSHKQGKKKLGIHSIMWLHKIPN